MKESKFYRLIRPVIPKPLRPMALKYQEYLSYMFFGGLTTLVNLVIYYPLARIMNYLVANVIAWLGAVIFAFVGNKVFVFEENSRDAGRILFQLTTFFSARLLSLLMEEGILYLFVDHWHFPSGIIKLVAQVLVIVSNYFASRFVVFRKR